MTDKPAIGPKGLTSYCACARTLTYVTQFARFNKIAVKPGTKKCEPEMVSHVPHVTFQCGKI